MRYMRYGNDGGIDEVKKMLLYQRETFNTVSEIFDKLVKEHPGSYDKSDLFLRYYGYDDRIHKVVYMVCAARSGQEDYMRLYYWPQFVCYVVEV